MIVDRQAERFVGADSQPSMHQATEPDADQPQPDTEVQDSGTDTSIQFEMGANDIDQRTDHGHIRDGADPGRPAEQRADERQRARHEQGGGAEAQPASDRDPVDDHVTRPDSQTGGQLGGDTDRDEDRGARDESRPHDHRLRPNRVGGHGSAPFRRAWPICASSVVSWAIVERASRFRTGMAIDRVLAAPTRNSPTNMDEPIPGVRVMMCASIDGWFETLGSAVQLAVVEAADVRSSGMDRRPVLLEEFHVGCVH